MTPGRDAYGVTYAAEMGFTCIVAVRIIAVRPNDRTDLDQATSDSLVRKRIDGPDFRCNPHKSICDGGFWCQFDGAEVEPSVTLRRASGRWTRVTVQAELRSPPATAYIALFPPSAPGSGRGSFFVAPTPNPVGVVRLRPR